jgi:hypothetical protein
MKVKREHLGGYKFNVEDFGFNNIVVAILLGDMEFGRLVQVRKKSGCFKTDTVFVRVAGGELKSYQNCGFFNIDREYLHLYENEMADTELDEPGGTYSLTGKNPATGFVVEGLDDTFGEESHFSMAITIKENAG